MTRVCLILVFILSGFEAFAQPPADTLYFNSGWEQCNRADAQYYRLVSFDTSGKVQLIVKDFYKSGKLQMCGTYLSIHPDVRMGTFTYWYENGIRQLECTYDHNLLNGRFTEWYENGATKSQRYFENGLQQGEEKLWAGDGLLQKIAKYKDGLKNGKFITFYGNRKPIRKDIYRNDSLVKGRCFTFAGKDTAYFNYFIMPRFEGGMEGFKSFITERLNYPDTAKENHEEGAVTVRFTIDKDGYLTKASLVKEDKSYFNDEALRVLSLSPKWIPGRRDGKNIDVTITLPILFRFSN